MQNRKIRLILLVIVLICLTSCASVNKTKMVPDSIVKDLTPGFQSGEFGSKVDGLVVLMDASSSMAETYQDYVKFDIAKAFVRRMNDTMPPICAVSGLRTFGHALQLTRAQTKLFYGMAPYNRQGMNKGLIQVTPSGGPTPLTAAITEAAVDLKNISGNKVVIIISDGKDLSDQPFIAAQNMQAMMADHLCIYTVMVGDDEKGKILMEKIARVSPCGFMILAQDVGSAQPMADYVSKVFLTKVEKIAEVSVSKEKKSASLKEDGLGYHKAEPLMMNLGNIHFNFDSSDLTKEGKTILDQHIQVLMNNPDVNVIIGGHASARGTHDHNQNLSEKRALAVKNYLIDVGDIPFKRLSAIGYGETRPAMYEPDPEQINSKEAKANMRVIFEVIVE
ncbi:MAG: OmpA family protein [Desulfobacula sp.]|uniref:OmpA family protein n=1 Tax=Desulfobacula sp. TaxID=2593537 RepID=UPI0025BC178D|nr:OmpA family protein [Desulfobacula sp.]MCD4719752.1 OmpA family protein [Desulfobacula sp.]